MSDYNIDIDEVRDYLQDKLSSQRKQEIDKMIASDPEYAREFTEQKELVESMTMFYRGKLKQRLKEEDQAKRPAQGKSASIDKRRWWAMVASLALIAVSGYLLFFSDPSSQELFDEHYKPYYNVLSSGERSGEITEMDAMSLYERGRYQEAIIAFHEEIKDPSSQTALVFYLGLSYLATDQPLKAIEKIEKVISGPATVLQEPAQWYLGLAYLKAEDIENAKRLFNEIQNSGGAYQDQSSEILDQLP